VEQVRDDAAGSANKPADDDGKPTMASGQPVADGVEIGGRGPLANGDRVQLTDAKGRHHTIILQAGKVFHTNRGSFRHDQLIGAAEGSVVSTASGVEFVVMRPLLSDFVLSMPRGAAVIYPKDAGQIVQMADIYPGARTIEAGVGSGGLTMSLLRAVGDRGRLVSVELRPEFAAIAEANVDAWFGRRHPAWELIVGELASVASGLEAKSFDRMVLDLLAPWDLIDSGRHLLQPGGVLIAYVATTTQLSRLVETLRDSGHFSEPDAWESIVRGWHLEGLAVRPDHRMVGHTGFLVRSRRLADHVRPPSRRRRPAPGAYDQEGQQWTAQAFGERVVSDRKLRQLGRKLATQSQKTDLSPDRDRQH
jgi:tRNA (adenine57-N1/adenine58-N1)-methyltransferase